MRRDNERYVVNQANGLIAWYENWILKPEE
jgi:hypothetical protein